MEESELKQKYGFDVYGRHKLTQIILNEYKKQNNIDCLKVLDIGGQFEVLKDFLPDDDIYIVDPNVKNQENKHIYQGDGSNLKHIFHDNYFDIVTSHDVIEHIPEEDRYSFLDECYRLSKYFFIVTAPFYSTKIVEAEEIVNNYYTILNNYENIWLKEHKELGLPKEDLIHRIVNEHSQDYYKFHNNNLNNWMKAMQTDFFIDSSKGLVDPQINTSFREFYNNEIYPYDFNENSYRTINIISKKKIPQNIIDSLEKLKKQSINSDKSLLQLNEKSFFIIAKIILTIKNNYGIAKVKNEKLQSRILLLKKVIRAKNVIIRDHKGVTKRKSVKLAIRIADSKPFKSNFGKKVLHFTYKILRIK